MHLARRILDLASFRSSYAKQRNLLGYLCILPATLIVFTIVGYPLIYNILLSLSRWHLRTRTREFIGFDNFIALIQDPIFRQVVFQSLTFLVLTVGIQLVFGLFVALLLQRCGVGRKITGALILIPWVTLFVVVGVTWSFLLHPMYGPLYGIFKSIGLEQLIFNALREPGHAMGVIILINAWKFFPFVAVMLLAGLQAVEEEQLEAATVDGANYLQRLLFVVLPSLRPILSSTILLSSAWALNTFTLPWVMTGGGPRRATEVLTIYIYKQGFISYDFGSAAAASVILFILVVLVTLPYAYLQSRR